MGVDGTGAGVDSTGAEVALVLALELDDDDDDMTMGIGDLEKSDDGTATSAGTDNVEHFVHVQFGIVGCGGVHANIENTLAGLVVFGLDAGNVNDTGHFWFWLFIIFPIQ